MVALIRPGLGPVRVLLGLLFALLLGAAGCRAVPSLPALPGQPSGTPGNPSAAVTDLVLWHSQTGAARAELEALARDFHSAHPDLTVTPVFVGNADDLEKQVTAAIALGQTPDLVLAPRRAIAAFARQGGLMALDNLSKEASNAPDGGADSDLLPGAREEGVFPEFGKTAYALPFDLTGMLLFYNADLLRAASFESPPATWSSFSDMATKLTHDDQYGWAMTIDGEVFAAMLASQGSAMIDQPEKRALFAERGGLASMTLAQQLAKAGAAKANSGDAARADFASGHAAFYIDWASRLPELQQAQKKAGADFQLALAGLPQADPASPFWLVQGDDLAIFKLPAERAVKAWLLATWLTDAPQAARWAEKVEALPPRASALQSLAGQASEGSVLAKWEGGLTTMPQLVPLPAHRQTLQILEQMEQAWSRIVLQKADVAATLNAAGASANQLLAVPQ